MAIDEQTLVSPVLRERIKLLAYVWAIVRDEHLAEDVYQETSLLAVQKRAEIQDPRHFLLWMRRTARFCALRALRKRNRCVPLGEELLDRLEEQWAEHDAAAGSDLTDALSQCLDRLTPQARNLVKLRYADGISGERLAALVQRKVNALYVALTRIHRFLADCVRRRRAEGGVAHG